MMGHGYECTGCDFEFCSGWSHHAGGQLLVCPSCATHYVLGDGASVWDPREGEILQLIDCDADDNKRTGTTCMVHMQPQADNEEWDGVFACSLRLRCPRCAAHERLIQEFTETRSALNAMLQRSSVAVRASTEGQKNHRRGRARDRK